jgi:hypothetical protein
LLPQTLIPVQVIAGGRDWTVPGERVLSYWPAAALQARHPQRGPFHVGGRAERLAGLVINWWQQADAACW